MASENAAEIAALRGWRVYFNTLTIPGRRNVSVRNGPVPGASLSSLAAGHCHLDMYSRRSVAQRQEKTAQGQ